MMKKGNNTMKQDTMNLDVKGNLARLLATENITVQHNNVQTASFDVKNRVLTLPIFKQKSGDVYDMLIAHECAHALWTPWEQWDGIDIDELRSYVNVLEDCRIDHMIQSKYPGVVKNYQNGFDILEKQNFFGISGKDINKDLMLIDKINLRSKSMTRLPFDFNDEENEWLERVDELKTFKQVLRLAKELLVWQKQQVEQMQKLPNFDESQMAMSYGLQDDDYDDEDGDGEDFENGQGSGSDTNEKDNSDEADEKNDFNNFGDQKADDEKDSNQGSSNGQGDTKHEDKKESQGEADSYAKGQGGFATKPAKKLKAITDDSFQENIADELVDRGNKGYNYGTIPKPNFGKDSCLTDYKTFLNDMRKYKVEQRKYSNVDRYSEWLDKAYKSFMKDNKKTVMYLVKEFEMKKAATAYKRAQTDKTGIIDPLKLKDYQFSDDIFKRLTVLPNGKNHGMMMLLDWSGSMSDVLFNTVKQLINLIEFTRKVNIPFEVYFFTSEREHREHTNGFNYKNGDWLFEDFHLVNCASHRMTKRELDEALKTLYHMGAYYDYNYTYRRSWDDMDTIAKYDNYGIPHQYSLGNTPLNESLIYMIDMIPMFQKKYGIEKTTFITLTDGASNYHRDKIYGSDEHVPYESQNVYQIGKKKYAPRRGKSFTSTLLTHIKNECDCNVIGFYIVKRVKRWDIERYIKDYKDYMDKDRQFARMRKEMTTNKAIAVDNDGYNKYFILDGKKLNVENFDMNEAEIKKGTASELKRLFGKSMANRLVSRVVLNKFIKEVA